MRAHLSYRSLLAAITALALAVALLIALPPTPAAAQDGVVAVTTTDDGNDLAACLASDLEDCTLREAILAANDDGDGSIHTITLTPGTYVLDIVGPGDDTGETGDLDVWVDLTIAGPGSELATIDASGLQDGVGDRVLHAHGATTLTLTGLTIEGGNLDSGEGPDDTTWYCGDSFVLVNGGQYRNCNGGGILLEEWEAQDVGEHDGTLTLTTDDVVVQGNHAEGSGGGIAAVGDHVVLDLTRTVITGNEAVGQGGDRRLADEAEAQWYHSGGGGGGVWVSAFHADLDFDDVTVGTDEDIVDPEEPPAGSNITGGAGGGMLLQSPGIDATLRTTAVDGNVAWRGGGISTQLPRMLHSAENHEPDRSFVMEDSSIDGNYAAQSTGGVHLRGLDAEFTRSSISGNAAQRVGGLLAESVDLTFVESVLGDNRSEHEGGGATLVGGSIGGDTPRGDVSIIDSTVTGNQGGWSAGGIAIFDYYYWGDAAGAQEDRPGPDASAQYYEVAEYELMIAGSTFSDNSSHYPWDDAAGGLLVAGAYSGSVENSTFSGNSSTDFGAGVLIYHLKDDLSFLNVTFEGNLATEGGGTPAAAAEEEHSGGVALHVTGPRMYVEEEDVDWVVTLASTILAGSDGDSCNDSERIVSLGHNIDDDGSCVGAEPQEQGDAVTDPELEPLADNGGPTLTHALAEGSPAIDAVADDAACPDTDQRGVERPQDGNEDGVARCDIGAYEHLAVAVADLRVEKSADEDAVRVGQHLTYTITVTNDGPDDATGVVVVDQLAASVTLLEVESSAGTCGQAGQAVTCEIGDLATGASESITLVVRTNAAGSVVNTATVAGDQDDPDLDNNVASVTVDVEGVITRLFGRDRIQTAIEIAGDQYTAGGAGAVVLARADLYPDALAGTPLAIDRDAPLLLTYPESLDSRTEAEIVRVLAPGGRVYLLGGTAALSAAVEARLDGLGFETVRYGGATRWHTAVQIADEGLDNPETLLVATGLDFPDALSAGAAAGVTGGAVVLTTGDQMHAATAAYIAQHPEARRFAVGGPAAQADPTATPLVGTTRIETSLAVANEFMAAPPTVGIATAYGFADALTGGAHVGRMNGPMLLTHPTVLPTGLGQYLEANRASISSAFFYGGTGVISAEVEEGIRQAIQ